MSITVIREAARDIDTRRRRRSVCVCICGTEFIARTDNILNGNTKSCGCLNAIKRIENGRTSRLRHGHASPNARSLTWRSWQNMLRRCRDQNNIGFKDYGGRGIRVCPRWAIFENFLQDMGERSEGYSLDRINSNGNYEKHNCQWATAKQQASNRRKAA